MAHEVVKHVRGRAYRYRVDSYRDQATGKVRGRWTYLGKVEADGAERAVTPRRSADTRERLIDALARLLETNDFADVTAGRIALEAGLAHGTFYRYFPDKQAALRAAAQRVRDEIDRLLPSFESPLGTQAEERARVRGWVESVMRTSLEYPGVMRAWYPVLAADPVMREQRQAKKAANVAALARYFDRLAGAGMIDAPDTTELASALSILLFGVFRNVVTDGAVLDEATIAGTLAVFDRAIFQAGRSAS